MKTILVPFDFSTYSLAALQTAQRICAKNQAKIICVTVIPSEIDWDLLSEEAKLKYPQLLEERQEAMEVLPGYIKSVAPAKAQIEQIIKIGVPYEQILRVAEQSFADLIVIGAYGKGHVEGNFVGSTLQKVIRFAPCPVLAVKSALDGNAFRKIAFATVFNKAGKVAFEKMLPLAKIFKTSIHLLYVNTPAHFTNSSKSDRDMAEFGKGHEQFVIHRHVYNHEDAEKGIMEFCEKNGIQLLGIVSGERGHASSYVIGTTETLIFKSDLGILSIKS
ncbi:MAG: universal stress protein [Algoriphagus sp.]|jgi:nucleotide-binding universal stress UspA family protein|uniref:universal stress protein n=1 Tax=Algoriphagus sp. TaxID=1872435 RepID=UPI002719FDE1|nr:universal stress protein [Algoriphagus sp.]MDO8966214.1 universal stress protein [Algoriphagus sp.]MDP2041822.1 universal stress protein [Algoriphagus sp.]MDP3198652.1 universal stress protein [Algoriphagus sp.]MDP3472083.1 universal stress protein [Algoriphagus sp.]